MDAHLYCINRLNERFCLLEKRIKKLEGDKVGEKGEEELHGIINITCPKCSHRIDFHLKRFGEREIICTNCFENVFV